MATTKLNSNAVAAGDVALASQYNSLITDIEEFAWTRCGRLTLGTSDPVTTTDISAATTIYYTPFMGNIFNTFHTSATFRDIYKFTEISLSLNTTDHPANTNFDLYIYHLSTSTDSTYMTLTSVAWTTDLTRDDPLDNTQGTYTRNGYNPGFYKFVGSFRTVAAGQTEDSVTKRFLSNYYNAVPKNMFVEEGTENTSSTDVPALWNGSTTNNQLGFVVCQPYGITVDCSMQAWLKVATADNFARSVMFRDGAASDSPRIEISNYNEYYVQCSSMHPQHFATGYHYVNSYVDGTVAGTATFDTLVLSAKVWV